MRGVKSVTTPRNKRVCGLDLALKDIEEGRVYRAESVDDMFKQILGDRLMTWKQYEDRL